MDKTGILKNITKKSGGEIYIGVVGAVRTGKSTFIKKCIENHVLPYMDDEYEKKRCLDEIPQSAKGKTIMTIEPKFVPSSGATIDLNGLKANIKLVDCVGYVTKDSIGYEDENGNPRMVKTPWFQEELPFTEAAEIGTNKVIKDHATIGIVITSDGTITDLNRSNYEEVEENIINELKVLNKPFIVVLNTIHPNSNESINLSNKLSKKYEVPVLPISIETMNENDITNLLREAFYEFKVDYIKFNIPDWIGALNNTHPLKMKFISKMKESTTNINKVRDTQNININLEENDEIASSYISYIDADNDEVTITLEAKEGLYEETLKSLIGENINSKGDLIKILTDLGKGKGEYKSIESALKQVHQTGYSVVLPTIDDMHLEKPEIIKQGNRYGIKLKAKATSIHMIKVDVESSFEPIIGSELQSKELIEYIMKDKDDPSKIWQSEIFGRNMGEIVGEGIQAKLALLPDNAKFKLSQTITKMVNKGSNNLIALVL